MTPEAKVTTAIVALFKNFKRNGSRIWWCKLAGGPRQAAGLPDFVVVFEGRTLFLEVKEPKGWATRLQERVAVSIGGAGGEWYLVRSAEEVLKIL